MCEQFQSRFSTAGESHSCGLCLRFAKGCKLPEALARLNEMKAANRELVAVAPEARRSDFNFRQSPGRRYTS
ncbi:MAG TPA: hypothetical protein VF828_00455 [Patescibacteria group bacterium]